MKYLSRLSSHYSPMIAWLESDSSKYDYSSFKYQKMWETHAEFWECVLRSWFVESGGVGIVRLVQKLKALKCVLRAWNKSIFGLTTKNIKVLEDWVLALEERLQEGFNEEVDLDLMVTKLELDTWVHREETQSGKTSEAKLAKIK